MNRLTDPIAKTLIISRNMWLQFCTIVVFANSFRSSVAVCADDFETSISCARHLRDSRGLCYSLAPISPNFSSARI
jgi:hypothetical protein